MVVVQSCQFFATPRTVPRQAPWSMGFSTQEYWSGLPFPPPGDLPNPRIESRSPALPHVEIYLPDQGLKLGSLHWEHGVLVTGPPGKPPNGLSEFSCLHLSYGVSVSARLMFGVRSFFAVEAILHTGGMLSSIPALHSPHPAAFLQPKMCLDIAQ